MSADRRRCPGCGEPVFATETQCMSCGADLRVAGRRAHSRGGQPAPPPPPRPLRRAKPSPLFSEDRPPIEIPFCTMVVESCGDAWGIFPWVYLFWSVAWFVVYLFFGRVSPALSRNLTIAQAVIWPVFLFWVICDVRHQGVGWWWIPACVCCDFGLLAYLLRGRDV